MFFNKQPKEQEDHYKRMLILIGEMSRLFSEGKEPYLEYRIAENLFCRAFGAKNLSRSDASADASKDGIGIGIKTFLNKNGSTMQKIAEFNSDHDLFRMLDDEGKIRKVSELRNERLEATKRIFDLDELIYHCIARREGGIVVFETPMGSVDVGNIASVSTRGNIISFRDGLNEYSFNTSKSTLYRRFSTQEALLDFQVPILDDPFAALEKLHEGEGAGLTFSPLRDEPHIFLPLYTWQDGKRVVQEKSGLNQWNAEGRLRNPDEVYIPIPAEVRDAHPHFFPGRDEPFSLTLPDGNLMSAKVCQDNSKALMSNPNAELGNWLLRKVLALKPRELLTYEKLERLGLDSVVLYKKRKGEYSIDFTRLGSYEKFLGKDPLPDED